MAPTGHLSDLCQQKDITPILDFLRHRVRGPLKTVNDTASTPVHSSSHLDPHQVEENSFTAAMQRSHVGDNLSREGEAAGGLYDDLMAYKDCDGRTALHWAIALRNYNLVSTLLQSPYNAPVLTWDRSKCTPFFTSCMVGADLALVRQLLGKSVEEYFDVWKRLEEGSDPIDQQRKEQARRYSNDDPCSSASPLSSSQPAVISKRAVMSSDDDTDEEEASQKWRTWEHCPLKRLEPSELSLSEEEGNGARSCIARVIVNAKDHSGNTPIQTAVSRGNEPLLEFLLENGGDFTVQNKLGQTPLHRAVSKGAFHLVEKLILCSEGHFGKDNKLKHRKFVNTPDNKGDTALFYASMENDEEIGCYLLQHGANRDHVNKQGKHFYEV